MDSNQQTNRLSENSDAIFKTLLAEAKESMAEIEVVGASSAPDFHALIKAARRSFLATRTLSARLGVRFTRLEWDALLTFAEAWSNVVRACNLPQGVLSKLPFKEIDIQLGTLLMHRFNLERILDLRQRFVQLKLKFLEEITISGEYRARWDALNAGWSQFEKTVSTTLRLSSDPDFANQISYLERLLQQFENTLNAHLGQLEKKGDKQSTKSDEKKDPLTFIQLQRDLSSVTRILQYIDLALRESVSASSSNAEQEKHQRLSRHLLERALQVIGESIKDTQQSSNLSTRTRTKLANAGVPLKKLESLRNRLSHFSGIHVGQRLSTEARITATLSVHELGKLRGVLQKSFDRLQFLMLKQVALGFYGRQREDQLNACKNVEDLLAEIPDGHGDDDYRAQLIALRDMAAIKSRMESLELATFKAQSQTENMPQQHSFVEWNLGEMKECANTDMNEGFGRRRTTKSTITKVSEFVGISALDDVGGGAVSNSIVPSKDAAEDSDSSSFEEFVSTGISIFFTQDQFESISTAVGLGLEPELDEYTIYEVEDELSISEEQLQALHLLNKVKYIWRLIDASKETHELLDTRSKDALIRLVESAREGQPHSPIRTESVQ